MVQLIVVIASILLGMLLYPILVRKWKQFVDWLHWVTHAGEEKNGPSSKTITQGTEKPSVIGKSKFSLRQSTPNAATNPQTEKAIEKEHTFVPSADETSEMQDVDVPLEKVEILSEEEFDAEEEEIELDIEKDAVQAGGARYEELLKTYRVISDHTASRQEEKDAGGVIYGQKGTNIFEQVAVSSEKTALRISHLIDIYLEEFVRDTERKNSTVNYNKQIESRDFKDFDINSIF